MPTVDPSSGSPTVYAGSRSCSRYAELTEAAELHLFRADQAAWLSQLAADHDNLRAAFASAWSRLKVIWGSGWRERFGGSGMQVD